MTQRIKPPRPSWAKWLWGGGAVALVVVVFVVLRYVVPAIVKANHSCGTGVEERGENSECIGTTDGEFVFSPTSRMWKTEFIRKTPKPSAPENRM